MYVKQMFVFISSYTLKLCPIYISHYLCLVQVQYERTIFYLYIEIFIYRDTFQMYLHLYVCIYIYIIGMYLYDKYKKDSKSDIDIYTDEKVHRCFL